MPSFSDYLSGFDPMGSNFSPATSISSLLTPQNSFQANAPLNSGQLAGYVGGSQQNLAGVNGQQGQLVNALMAQSQGQGPNPAQATLNQATNQGIQQATGQIASQKGISPALAARQSSMNAAGSTQQAAQAGAIMNAQQQLAAQQGAASVLGQQANQNLQNTATTGGLANQTSLGAQGINAATSAQNAAANQNTFGGLLNGLGSAVGLGGLSNGGTVGYDNGGTIDMPSYQAGGAQQGKSSGGSGSGILGSIGGALAFLAQGGSVPQIGWPGGAYQAQMSPANQILAAAGVPSYQAGGAQQGQGNTQQKKKQSNNTQPQNTGAGDFVTPDEATAAGMQPATGGLADDTGMINSARGGIIPGHLQQIAQIYHPNFRPAKNTTRLKSNGGPVPGKAKVPGDSPKNDTVKTMLSPGEVVIPRSIMESEDPVKMASKFVANELAKRGSSQDDFKMALKKAISTRKAS